MNSTIVTLKAFGDFLIAYQSIKYIFKNRNMSIRIIAGHHVQPLAEALNVSAAYVEFLGSEHLISVPAAFDIKRQGGWAALNSLVDLRLKLAPFARGSQLIFDRLGWRERFIAGAGNSVALPTGMGNIYLAYEGLFRFKGFDIESPRLQFGSQPRVALIVPGSRISGKVIPAAVQVAIYTRLMEQGISARVLKLDGEDMEIPEHLPIRVLPHTFSALITALQNTDLVVSADSLSAHLGEYFGLPTFVVSPIPNPYWLPRQAFLTHATALFDDLSPLTYWLAGLSDGYTDTFP